MDLVEVEYVTKYSNTMSTTPELKKVIQFKGYSTVNENIKIDYGFINVLGVE